MSFPTQIQHIVVIAFENKDFSAIMSDPYFAYLANTYGNCTNYTQAGCHPSLPNYIAATSGTTRWNGSNLCGTDTPPGGWGSNNSENIFDLVNKAGLTWMGYAEPDSGTYSPCSTTNITVRHFPPMFYSDIVGNASYCQNHIRPISDWYNLVSQSNPTMPNIVWITPNICDDAHDCSLSTASNWLKSTFNLPNLISKFVNGTKDTAFIIWFDESGSSSNTALTYCSVISPITNKLTSNKSYNPYNVLSTFEWLLGLPSTGNNDATATPMKDLFATGPAFSVSLSIHPKIIDIGQSTTLTANVSGGVQPYNYSWAGLPGNCAGGNVSTITCNPNMVGIYNVTVSVTDSSI